jgi:hypothetical protein
VGGTVENRAGGYVNGVDAVGGATNYPVSKKLGCRLVIPSMRAQARCRRGTRGKSGDVIDMRGR